MDVFSQKKNVAILLNLQHLDPCCWPQIHVDFHNVSHLCVNNGILPGRLPDDNLISLQRYCYVFILTVD
jgi:hypothetical protein